MRWSHHKFKAAAKPLLVVSGGNLASVAGSMGFAYHSVYRWLRKGETPRRDRWPQIADALGVTVEALTVEGR